jgi:type VI secretion system protein ImpH
MHALVYRLIYSPQIFDFVQGLRILERQNIISRPAIIGNNSVDVLVGEYYSARFLTQTELNFPHSVIPTAVLGDNKRINFTISTMGLTGPLGVLPYSYSIYINTNNHEKNTSLKAFIDLLQDRSIQLFYGACSKYRLSISYERNEKDKNDDFRNILESFVGIHSQYLRERLEVDDNLLLYYSGYFSSQTRNIYALEKILSDQLEANVRIDPFKGYWLGIPLHEKSSIGNNKNYEHFNILGLNSITGDKVWSAQDSFRIYIGPVEFEKYLTLLPEEKGFLQIKSIVNLYCGLEFRYEIQILLEKASVPYSSIVSTDEKCSAAILGIKSWLLTSKSLVSRDDTTIVVI